MTFVKLLETALCRDQTAKSWCEACAKFQIVQQRRRTASLPNVLMVAANVAVPANLAHWQSKADAFRPTDRRAAFLPTRCGSLAAGDCPVFMCLRTLTISVGCTLCWQTIAVPWWLVMAAIQCQTVRLSMSSQQPCRKSSMATTSRILLHMFAVL